MKELTEEEKANYLEWSEGNTYLYKLLCTCGKNGITTFASCGGHKRRYPLPYVGMIINDDSLPFIKSVLGKIQNTQNIIISSGVRRNSSAVLFDDDELRALTFHAYNFNCCELFYKILMGIECKDSKITLNPKMNRFYDNLKILNETSRDELQKYVNSQLLVGGTISSNTQEFIDYENSKKLIRNNKFMRFFRKFLPSQKTNVLKYEELRQKYDFLQRVYVEDRSTKMEQFRVENLDTQGIQSNYRQKVKDAESIEISKKVETGR